MNIEQMREEFEAWRAARCMNDTAAKASLEREGDGYYGTHTELAWQAWRAAAAATQRDAMAVAEAVRDACATECNKMQAANMAISKDFKDRSFARLADGGLECKESIAKIDLAALIESAQPASARQQGEPVARIDGVDEYGLMLKWFRHWVDLDGANLYTATPATSCSVPDGRPAMTSAAIDVMAERHRQVVAEGWSLAHDDNHDNGQLSRAAACYAMRAHDPEKYKKLTISRDWPWDRTWWKPSTARRDLVKAGALILAEIERLDRAAQKPEGGDA